MLITTDKYGPIQFQPVEKDAVTDFPGLQTLKASGSFGEILHQTYNSTKYCVQYFHMECGEELILHFISNASSAIKCCVCLKDGMNCCLQDEVITLNRDQYLLYDGSVKIISLNCLPQASYKFITIDYRASMLRQLRAQYADLDNWIGSQIPLLSGSPAYKAYASNNLRELFVTITDTQLPAFLQHPWFDNKLACLLIEQFATLYNPTEPKGKFLDDIATRAHDYILQNIGQQCSIPDIAGALNINVWYLKTSFRKKYGINVYKFLRNESLKYARHLLLNTDMPLKQISGIVGFEHTTNFSTTFRDYFDYTPGSLRRKK